MKHIHSWTQSSKGSFCELICSFLLWILPKVQEALGANKNRFLSDRLPTCKWSFFPGATLTKESWVFSHNNPFILTINANWSIRIHQLRLNWIHTWTLSIECVFFQIIQSYAGAMVSVLQMRKLSFKNSSNSHKLHRKSGVKPKFEMQLWDLEPMYLEVTGITSPYRW